MNKIKDIYSDYIKDELWLIKETKWARSLQNIREAQFALGNGYLGTRGIYEEIPYDCKAGTYISGLYDRMTAQVSELVNLPNPINFNFTIDGEKLGVVSMETIEHRRVLNMKKATLVRRTIFKDSRGRRYNYQSLRFISQHDKNIGAMQIVLTPLDSNCMLDISTGIDTSVSNSGILTEGKKKHFRIKELGQQDKAGFLVAETFEKRYSIIYWSGFYYEINGKKIIQEDNIFRLKLKKNQSVVFNKIFCIKHFHHKGSHVKQKEESRKTFNKAFQKGLPALLKEHIRAWELLWKKADIVLEGTANLQQNMRFNIYHMLNGVHYDNGASSIGARILSGEGYRGHVFWDAEIFLLPFYLFTFPKVAKNMLLYRYHRLYKARAIAKRNGFKGAQFPWECADTGEEETPERAVDIDRTVIKIYTHIREHHITADIAYAIYKYYVVTGDEKFMEQYGYEIFVETARFWASRVEWNKRRRRYVINHIIGPDEFRLDVNNNAFTNMMAKWNLLTANKLCNAIKKRKDLYEKLNDKLNLKEKEIKNWKAIASKIWISASKKGIIEQHEGFFKLKKVNLTKTDENGIPLIPGKIKAKDLGKTQLIKQADVLMLINLLDDVFSEKTKLLNYKFYFPRTVHKSSLSPAMHALIAGSVQELQTAYNLFNLAVRVDVGNLFKNTEEGIHAACLGGTWQALVFGFAGVKIKKEELYINPCIPYSWQKLIFNLAWRGDLIKLEVKNEAIKIKVSSAKVKNIKIGVFDRSVSLKTNRVYAFRRRAKVYKEEYY